MDASSAIGNNFTREWSTTRETYGIRSTIIYSVVQKEKSRFSTMSLQPIQLVKYCFCFWRTRRSLILRVFVCVLEGSHFYVYFVPKHFSEMLFSRLKDATSHELNSTCSQTHKTRLLIEKAVVESQLNNISKYEYLTR